MARLTLHGLPGQRHEWLSESRTCATIRVPTAPPPVGELSTRLFSSISRFGRTPAISFPALLSAARWSDLFPRSYGVSDAAYQKLRERISIFAGFNPEFNAYERKLNYGTGQRRSSLVPFSQNTHTDYAYGRIDAEVTQKIRVFGSWLASGSEAVGRDLARLLIRFRATTTSSRDAPEQALLTCCPNSFIDPADFSHTLGYSAPNMTLNTGADITITNNLVSTTRFGYYFENYHDIGFPTNGDLDVWETNGSSAADTNGVPLSTSAPALARRRATKWTLDQNFTHYNSNKATQFDEDFAWFKSGSRYGTHNVKFGYQLHRNVNLISQGYNQPEVQVYPGTSGAYNPVDPNVGYVNCGSVERSTAISGTPLWR